MRDSLWNRTNRKLAWASLASISSPKRLNVVSTNSYLVRKMTGKGKDTGLELCKLVNIFRKKKINISSYWRNTMYMSFNIWTGELENIFLNSLNHPDDWAQWMWLIVHFTVVCMFILAFTVLIQTLLLFICNSCCFYADLFHLHVFVGINTKSTPVSLLLKDKSLSTQL